MRCTDAIIFSFVKVHLQENAWWNGLRAVRRSWRNLCTSLNSFSFYYKKDRVHKSGCVIRFVIQLLAWRARSEDIQCMRTISLIIWGARCPLFELWSPPRWPLDQFENWWPIWAKFATLMQGYYLWRLFLQDSGCVHIVNNLEHLCEEKRSGIILLEHNLIVRYSCHYYKMVNRTARGRSPYL